MRDKPGSTIAYRASQFVLNNQKLIYCHCAKPDIEYTKATTGWGPIAYCYVCRRMITREELDKLRGL